MSLAHGISCSRALRSPTPLLLLLLQVCLDVCVCVCERVSVSA